MVSEDGSSTPVQQAGNVSILGMYQGVDSEKDRSYVTSPPSHSNILFSVCRSQCLGAEN